MKCAAAVHRPWPVTWALLPGASLPRRSLLPAVSPRQSSRSHRLPVGGREPAPYARRHTILRHSPQPQLRAPMSQVPSEAHLRWRAYTVALYTTRVSSCSPLREASALRRCRCRRLCAATRAMGPAPATVPPLRTTYPRGQRSFPAPAEAVPADLAYGPELRLKAVNIRRRPAAAAPPELLPKRCSLPCTEPGPGAQQLSRAFDKIRDTVTAQGGDATVEHTLLKQARISICFGTLNNCLVDEANPWSDHAVAAAIPAATVRQGAGVSRWDHGVLQTDGTRREITPRRGCARTPAACRTRHGHGLVGDGCGVGGQPRGGGPVRGPVRDARRAALRCAGAVSPASLGAEEPRVRDVQPHRPALGEHGRPRLPKCGDEFNGRLAPQGAGATRPSNRPVRSRQGE